MRVVSLLIFGVAGFALMVGLGVWQVHRLAWKQDVLAEIEARIVADPVALPLSPDPSSDRYLPVTAEGAFTGEDLAVLASAKGIGPIYRLIAVLETTDGRRVLVDRGYVPVAETARTAPAASVRVTGNLHWPDEVNNWTPEPDLGAGLWFARDVPAMAAALNTEPLMVVARQVDGAEGVAAMPLPVGTDNIPNDHLQYAITWFSLAAIWLGMTGVLLWRIRRRSD